MPFSIVVEDVSKMKVDAVVNSTNRHMVCGGRGVDYSIHKAAGPELQAECLSIAPCEVTEVKITGAYNIPCKIIIHTVGPRWDGTQNCIALLRKCYENVIQSAIDHGCRSIAIPLISSGYHRFPKDVVISTATEVSKQFLEENDLYIYLNVYKRASFSPTTSFYPDRPRRRRYLRTADKAKCISYCGSADHNVMPDAIPAFHEAEQPNENYELPDDTCSLPFEAFYMDKQDTCAVAPCQENIYLSDFDSIDVDDLDIDESFGQLVTRLAEKYFDKTSQFYVAANITKSVYSKMKNQPTYVPSRSTALACAVVLKGKGVNEAELLSHAGMVLTPSDKRDRIIQIAFLNGIYDVFKINEVLFDHDLPLLGYKA